MSHLSTNWRIFFWYFFLVCKVFEGLFAFRNIANSLSAVSFTESVGYFSLQLVISRSPRVAIAPIDCSRKGIESSSSGNESMFIFSLIGGIFTGKLTFAYLTGFDKNLISLAGFSKMNLLSKEGDCQKCVNQSLLLN